MKLTVDAELEILHQQRTVQAEDDRILESFGLPGHELARFFHRIYLERTHPNAAGSYPAPVYRAIASRLIAEPVLREELRNLLKAVEGGR